MTVSFILPKWIILSILEFISIREASAILSAIDPSLGPSLPLKDLVVTWPPLTKRDKIANQIGDLKNRYHRVYNLRYTSFSAPDDLLKFINLQHLEFTRSFNYPINTLLFPPTVTTITFGRMFNIKLLSNNTIKWPPLLHTINLSHLEHDQYDSYCNRYKFSSTKRIITLPSTIQVLIIHYIFFRIISNSLQQIPSLQKLIITTFNNKEESFRNFDDLLYTTDITNKQVMFIKSHFNISSNKHNFTLSAKEQQLK